MATGFSTVRQNIIRDVKFPDLPSHITTRLQLETFLMSQRSQQKTSVLMILSRYLNIVREEAERKDETMTTKLIPMPYLHCLPPKGGENPRLFALIVVMDQSMPRTVMMVTVCPGQMRRLKSISKIQTQFLIHLHYFQFLQIQVDLC